MTIRLKLTAFRAALLSAANTLGRVLSSAVFWSLLLLIGGAALIGAGVGLQFGLGFGLIAGGVFAVSYGGFILKGIKNG